jgi:tRNA threonylcarbamoyl adenosine modification protein (Sua5/YciO/YrdC/YwlC family)
MKKMNNLQDAVGPLMRGGAVGVMPTDTVYGLVARAADRQAVARLYALKHREHKPGTVIAASVEQLMELGVEERYLRRVAHWWPAEVSVETPLASKLSYMHQGTGREGLRVVADERVRKVLMETGPLVTSSANQPGEPGSNTVAEAEAYFGDSVDFYVDGGDLTGRPPSTLVKVTDGGYEVIRQGAVRID